MRRWLVGGEIPTRCRPAGGWGKKHAPCASPHTCAGRLALKRPRRVVSNACGHADRRPAAEWNWLAGSTEVEARGIGTDGDGAPPGYRLVTRDWFCSLPACCNDTGFRGCVSSVTSVAMITAPASCNEFHGLLGGPSMEPGLFCRSSCLKFLETINYNLRMCIWVYVCL